TRVLGFDPRQGAAEEAGAEPALSAAEVAASSDVIFLSLPDSSVVAAVSLGDDGVLARARDAATIVDLSTSSPASTRRLHELATARGLAYLDAGISGGAAAAEAGTLTLMVGGESEALERVRATLASFAANVFHVGA